MVPNVRSIRLVERLGFQREGTQRLASLEDDGSYSDRALYGLLKSEWRGVMRSRLGARR